MWENSRLLLALCVVCGAVGSYLLSVYVLLVAFVVCVCIFVIDSKLLGQASSVVRNFTFPVPSWIKSTITFLMNSYHLSKPLETESGSRRSSPYSPNVSVHRRPSCRTGRFTCLDENTDYANRRNGIGLCSPGPAFNNSYSNSLHGFRRHSGFNDSENSPKIEEFSTPQTSPWTRRQNYSGNEFSNVRRVQTVAGPLLATSGLTKRKSNDFGLYVDANSPGLASRIVQYREEAISSSDSVWTHQPQYNSPGQFPMVHLSHSPSSLPVLSPLSSQKASRRSVRVKIAPPDPLGSRLYPLSTKSTSSYVSTIQTDHSMKSVLETLKEISRKRIHSQLEDNDDDAAKRQKRSGPLDILGAQTDDNGWNGENVTKRLREESPRQQELSPPTRPAKRIRNNEISSSLSSSRKLIQGGGMKRKTHSLDWSRCSTPVLGKQQKTGGDEPLPSPSPVSLLAQRPAPSSQPFAQEDLKRHSQQKHSVKTLKTPIENERKNINSLSSGSLAGSSKEGHKQLTQATPATPKAAKASIVDHSPWQKDSPFISVSSPDDIIDDVSALEEKREEDRRSRLMAMMTVISGGEPPVKQFVKPASATAQSPVPSLFGPSTTSFAAPLASNGLSSKVASAKPLLASALANGWSTDAASSTTSLVATVAPVSTPSTEPLGTQSPAETTSAPALLSGVVSSSPMFTLGNAASPIANASSIGSNNTPVQTVSANSSPQLPVAPVFGSLSAQASTPVSSPMVFGSAPLLFGSKTPVNAENTPSNNQHQSAVSTAVTTVSENISFGQTSGRQVLFGGLTSSGAQPTLASTSTTVSTLASPVPSSTVFQLNPATSGVDQDNAVSSSSVGFTSVPSSVAAATPGQTNIFMKTPSFGDLGKTPQNSVATVASGTPLFGSLGNPSVTPISSSTSSFAFGSSGGSVPATSSQVKSGPFAFGTTTAATPSPQTVSNSNTKTAFGSASGGFGQAVGTSAANTTVPNQPLNSQIPTSKIGGFQFDLASDKTPAGTQPSSLTTNVFGNPTNITNESKPFAFGSAKSVENPFALNTSQNNSTTVVSQSQMPANPFGTSVSQKPSDLEKPRENIFSLGAHSTASPGFSAPQTTFSTQPAATTTSAVNNGFSFSSAAPSGFSQPQSGAGVFSIQTATAPAATFGMPTTTAVAANSGFSFGSAASNAAPQTNPFAFGTGAAPSEPQPGGLFSFGGGSGAGAGASAGGMFGQPAAPAAPLQAAAVQPPAAAAAPAPTFQFGAAAASQPQVAGAFSFGSPPAANAAPAPGFPTGTSFQVNAGGGFGGAPAMFSIGSGSTAPRVRSARQRRTK